MSKMGVENSIFVRLDLDPENLHQEFLFYTQSAVCSPCFIPSPFFIPSPYFPVCVLHLVCILYPVRSPCFILTVYFYEALLGEGPISLARILKRPVSVFINASRHCWKLNKNSLSLSEF